MVSVFFIVNPKSPINHSIVPGFKYERHRNRRWMQGKRNFVICPHLEGKMAV